MSQFSKLVNLLVPDIFTDVLNSESFVYLKSQEFLNSYIIPTRFLSKFKSKDAYNIFKSNPNTCFYIKDSFIDEYKFYLKKIELSLDFIDVFFSKDIAKKRKNLTEKNTFIFEVTPSKYKLFREFWEKLSQNSQEHLKNYNLNYMNFFYSLSNKKRYSEKIYKTYILLKDNTVVASISVVFDPKNQISYIHNLKTINKIKKIEIIKILLENIYKICEVNNIFKVFSIIEKNSSYYKIFKKLKFKENNKFYVYS